MSNKYLGRLWIEYALKYLEEERKKTKAVNEKNYVQKYVKEKIQF